MNATYTPTTVSQITFVPVVITRGRKFRGKAYFLGDTHQNQVAWNVVAYSTRLWDPANKKYVYANPDFCDDDASVTEDERLRAKDEYILGIINDTINWCRNQNPGQGPAEVNSFARNVLRRRHYDLMADIDILLPDSRDIKTEIQKTVEWAMTLTTRPCYMYGRFCEGGRPLPIKRKLDIARKSLTTKGIAKLPGFEEAWQACLAEFQR